MSNDDSTSNRDNRKGDNVSRRNFIKVSAGTFVSIYLGSFTFGCNDSGSDADINGYPIDSNVYTTAKDTVKLNTTFSGTILPQNLSMVSQYDNFGYGAWSHGGPLPYVKRGDIMSAGYVASSANKKEQLLRFFTISDIHITDKESPSQLIYLQQANISGYEANNTAIYSPTMLYTTHVLDATLQTINALHKQNPIDFGLSLGDACNSTQYNELRWYIDVFDGKVITPSSGANAGAYSIDYQKTYKAAGLDKSIPWYQAIGNHDHFWLGSIPPDAGNLRKTCISDEIIAGGDVLATPNDIYSFQSPGTTQYYMGTIDGATPYGEIVKSGPVASFSSPPKVIPDNNRRSLTKTEWVNEFYNTTTNPVGHGFGLVPSGEEEGFACYSFVPKSNIPIKIIVLDDTQREDDGSTSIHGHGFLDAARWAWLKNELAAGDAANQLMIIAAHVPIGVQPANTFMEWFDNSKNPSGMQNAVNLTGLLTELHNHPNLLMWIAGHRHVNTVKAFYSDNPSKPERGFWHVETSSLHNFPQQFRIFEIVLNSDYTISIFTVNVDPAVKAGTPAATSRKYAVAAQQILNNQLSPNFYGADPTITEDPNSKDPDPTIVRMDNNILSYNAELFKQLGPEMKAKMQSLFP